MSLIEKHQELLKQFIAQHPHMSLERLDKVLEETRRKEGELLDKIKGRAAAEGIDLGVINECERVAVDQRTALEQRIVDTQRPARRLTENNDIDEQLQAQLAKTQTYLAEWQRVRELFTDLYPEATTSPRLSRPELEQSPARSMLLEKSKSASSLPSFSLISPRRLLRNSGKMATTSCTSSGNLASNTSAGSPRGNEAKKETSF